MAIKCEICGSNDLVKENGLFVCQNCGCKYSADEVRKMLGTEETAEEQSATQKMLADAISEYNSGRKIESWGSFQKVLDTDPENCIAMIYQAYSDGWSSTVENNRINLCADELEKGFAIMREGVTDEEFVSLSLHVLNELNSIGLAIFNILANYEAEVDNIINEYRKTANGVAGDIDGILSGNHLIAATSIIGGAAINSDGIVTADQLEYEKNLVVNTVNANTCIAMNNVLIYIINQIDDNNIKSKSFYQYIFRYTGSYRDRLTVDSVKQNYDSIIAYAKKQLRRFPV